MSDDAKQYELKLCEGVMLEQANEATGLTPDCLSGVARKGGIWIRRRNAAGVLRKPARIREIAAAAVADDILLINYDPQVLSRAVPAPLMVSDQGNFSVWDKPAGVNCQGSKWADHCSLTAMVEMASGRAAQLVHRLDRAASGLIVIAHTRNACSKLAKVFAERQVKKIYHATVHGLPQHPVPWLISNDVDGKSALTEVQKVAPLAGDDRANLTVRIETGRKHQIRAHLAQGGFPIVGDRLFDPQRKHADDLQLRAVELQFRCPFSGNPLCFKLDAN